MDVREATTEDVRGIRTVANASLEASYGHALDEELIAEAVNQWYDEDELAGELVEDDTVFIVGVEDGDVVAFAQSYVTQRRETVGEIDWLHVDPDHREQGFGVQLLKRVETELLDADVDRLEGRVLEANEAGGAFYEEHGYEITGERMVEIGSQEFRERIFSKYPEGTRASRVVIEGRTGPEGQQLFVAYDESVRASKAPFYPTYTAADRSERYGWFCGSCESFDTAMDSMDRIECNECGNRRKAARWDAAYL